ncbi:MAG: hypothetical protein CFE44_10260 [Burkholderiales bacterium PBB4]|nr:MAG: hypothetical protein CFE44_10260 [Burkholderiales bacterium PBB4]
MEDGIEALKKGLGSVWHRHSDASILQSIVNRWSGSGSFVYSQAIVRPMPLSTDSMKQPLSTPTVAGRTPGPALVTAVLLAASCHFSAPAGTVERLIDLVTPGPRTEIVITTDHGYRLSARLFGEVLFNEALTDVVSAKGRATLEETRLGVSRSMVFAPQPDGSLRRTYVVNGREMPLDAVGQHWLAQTIQKLVREHALESGPRVQQLAAKGGVDAVIAEIEKTRADPTRTRYIEHLTKAGPLNEAQLERLLVAIAAQVGGSAFEARQQLSALIDKRPLHANQQLLALQAIGRMDSAFDRRTTLAALAPKLATDPRVAAAWLGAVGSMRSDFDMRTALEDLMQSPVATQHLELALQATLGVRTSFERSTALSAVLPRMPQPSPAQLAVFLKSSQGVSSEFERSNLLVALTQQCKLDATGQAAVRKLAEGIRADHERRKVLAALGAS